MGAMEIISPCFARRGGYGIVLDDDDDDDDEVGIPPLPPAPAPAPAAPSIRSDAIAVSADGVCTCSVEIPLLCCTVNGAVGIAAAIWRVVVAVEMVLV